MTMKKFVLSQVAWGHSGKIDYDNGYRPKRKNASSFRTMRRLKKRLRRQLDKEIE
jgi:hypothetical protein